MNVTKRMPLQPSLVLFGFIPVDLYVQIVGNNCANQKISALTHLNKLLQGFIKSIPNDLESPSLPINDLSLEITAHISSLLTLLQKILNADNIALLNECLQILSASLRL